MHISMGRLQMFKSLADSFFSNILTRPRTQISLLNQQTVVLTQVYKEHKATRILLQICNPPIHCTVQAACTCILNNVDEDHTKCTPIRIINTVAFYLYVLDISFVQTGL